MTILIVDVETTGLDPATAEVIELAGVTIGRYPKPDRSWSSLIYPKGSIPPETSAIHHLTVESFINPEDGAYKDLPSAWIDMLEGKIPNAYAAHNAQFDRGFIAKLGYGGSAPWLCTWRCALHLWPDAPAYGNQVLRYYLGLKPDVPKRGGVHCALTDAIVTAEILKAMLDLKSLEELLKLQYQPVLLKTCKLPKHRGVLWKDVPKGYLRWISEQNFDQDVMWTAEYYLKE